MKKINKISAIVLTLVFVLGLAGAVKAAAAATVVPLSTADSFAILAYSGITIGGSTNTSTITGDIGSYPTATITGIGNAILNGVSQSAGVSQAAQTALTAAYTAASQTSTNIPGSDNQLGNTTLTPGVYDFSAASTANIIGTLTLDGQGDPNAVFIFKAPSTLVTAASSIVSLINSAQACNVFWQVGSSATLGAASTFKGNILASVSATLGTTANVEGRVLASTGFVTLTGSNVITRATCVTPAPAAVVTGAGANYWGTLPLIDVIKVPSPLALPAGPGPVTYTYTVTNIGKVPLATVWVKDNKCAAVQYVSGDTNNDTKLDLTETWIYRCTKTVAATETNTATAHGYSNGVDVYKAANTTVVVGLPIIPPLIHIVKTPSVSVLPVGGGVVTYSYQVTNPGVASLSDVSVIDNKCTGLPGRVVGHPGDINKNGLLDHGETFYFTCLSNLTQTTTNLATAEGHANGLTAIDFATVTVVVATPGLPNTGLPPETNTAMIVGALVAVTALAALALKRRTV